MRAAVLGAVGHVTDGSLRGQLGFVYATSLTNSTVLPTDSHTTEVMAVDFPMQQGETRRVTDQLSVTLSTNDAAEIDNQLICTEPGGQMVLASDGTNWVRAGRGVFK